MLFGLINDAHAALKYFADDLVMKIILYAEQCHPCMVEKSAALSSPAKADTRAGAKNNNFATLREIWHCIVSLITIIVKP
jgi:hypothetical protein